MADKKLRVLGTIWSRWEENEDGDKIKRKYKTGDVVTIRSGQADALLKLNVAGRPLFEEYGGEEEKPKAAAPQKVSTEK